MNVNIEKTVNEIAQKLIHVRNYSEQELNSARSLVTKLNSQLIGLMYESRNGRELLANIAKGEVADDTVTLTIDEPLPSVKEFTASMQDYWLDLIHAAIKKAALGQKLPKFEKAFVLIEITTIKHNDNSKLWDTSNRAINLIINNLKGIFFKDDNFRCMAFGVVGDWGETGKTTIKIMPFERFAELILN
jgi:hypothetical protein